MRDITGNKYGRLTVISYNVETKKWVCKCECGNIKEATYRHLTGGGTRSCGCLSRDSKVIDLKGKRFGNWVVLERDYSIKKIGAYWRCKCDCGNIRSVSATTLIRGKSKSCGCKGIGSLLNKRNNLHAESFIEEEIEYFVNSLSDNIFNKVRILNEDVIYCDKLKLGIECNESSSNKKYHQEKFLKAKELGIHLISIFDVDYIENKEKILNYLKDLICPSFRIYARKCSIIEVPKKEAWEFYDKYHLQSRNVMSQINYGLTYNNELVAVMGFGNIRMGSKEGFYELHRYCVKSGYAVIGGADRLFNRFITSFSPEYIKSYSDNNYFTGNMYERMGFTYKGQTTVSYYWNLGGMKIKREQSQVKKLKIKFPQLFPQLYKEAINKEDFIMTSIGALKVYMAGNSIWEYK